ncbi:MAG: lipid-A-disaccharide synthase-related protein [Candidatus Sericytochromatia bacterium]|nr:lipid-A-disaccharide synthase-related protein [Candidatus Sericytochromatia bacterium]
MPHLLLISNGHGEDAIGARLAGALRAEGCTLEALAIVGAGRAYAACDVALAGPAVVLPSGGFIQGRPRELMRDLRQGLLGLTRAQWAAVRAGRARWDGVLAIGDVVPLAFAGASGRPYGFVGCAKSDWHRGGRPGSYGWLERWLLRRAACLGVWPRDPLTTDHLRAAGVRAAWLGNPMMDGLTPTRRLPGVGGGEAEATDEPGARVPETVLLLPGSRAEAPRNLALLAEVVRRLQHPGRRFLAALGDAPEALAWVPAGWTKVEGPGLMHPDGARIGLVWGAFAEALQAADVVLAMAGTATEQAVGLGKPAVTLPGPGPQFTRSFAQAQGRLLGEAVWVASGPDEAAGRVAALLAAPAERLRLGALGQARLGPAGASARIARAFVSALQP